MGICCKTERCVEIVEIVKSRIGFQNGKKRVLILRAELQELKDSASPGDDFTPAPAAAPRCPPVSCTLTNLVLLSRSTNGSNFKRCFSEKNKALGDIERISEILNLGLILSCIVSKNKLH